MHQYAGVSIYNNNRPLVLGEDADETEYLIQIEDPDDEDGEQADSEGPVTDYAREHGLDRLKGASFLQKCFKFLTVKCPFGERHWRWERLCFHGFRRNTETWHGGVLDLKSGLELQACAHCAPYESSQWALSPEEEQIMERWHDFRSHILNEFTNGYKYRIFVYLQDEPIFLYGQAEGPQPFSDPSDLFLATSPIKPNTVKN
jgi:hypothetical protein